MEPELEVARDWKRCTTTNIGPVRYAPLGRYGHTSVLRDEDMVVFGGSSSNGRFCEDIALWHLESLRWLEPVKALLNGNGRSFHSACFYGGLMYVFGGKANGYRNDLWAWNESGWKAVVPVSAKQPMPGARWGQASCLVGNQWYIHGGYDSDAMYQSDLWVWNMETKAWSKLKQLGERQPDSRMHHTLVHMAGKLYLWGGKTNTGPCDTVVHVFDLQCHKWADAKPQGQTHLAVKKVGVPAARWGHSCTSVLSPDDPTLLVFGGRNQDAVFGDAWAFRVKAGVWEQWDAQFSPEPRAMHSATLFGERLHIFGGNNLDQYAFDSLFKIDLTKECLIKMLPADLSLLLFSYLEPPDLLKLAQVCKHFATLCSADRLWKPIYNNLDRWFTTASWMRSADVEHTGDASKMSYKLRCRAVVVPNLKDWKIKKAGLGGMVNVKCVVVGDGAVGTLLLFCGFSAELVVVLFCCCGVWVVVCCVCVCVCVYVCVCVCVCVLADRVQQERHAC
jgi:hypothetical protein